MTAQLPSQHDASSLLGGPQHSGACWGAGELQAKLLRQAGGPLSKGQLRPILPNEAKVPNPKGLEWAIEAGAFDCSHNGLGEAS